MKASGNVIGITSSSLSGAALIRAGKPLPQNVNYAMKASYIRPLVASTPGLLGKLTRVREDRAFREIQEEVEKAVGFVLIFKESSSTEGAGSAKPREPESSSGEIPAASVRLISRVAVSSVLTPQRTKVEGAIVYAPRNLFDGDAATAWVEGGEGRGTGEWIKVEFSRPVGLSALKVRS